MKITPTSLVTLITVTSFIWTVIGFLIGKYQERRDWNKLIEEGKLPKPRGHE